MELGPNLARIAKFPGILQSETPEQQRIRESGALIKIVIVGPFRRELFKALIRCSSNYESLDESTTKCTYQYQGWELTLLLKLYTPDGMQNMGYWFAWSFNLLEQTDVWLQTILQDPTTGVKTVGDHYSFFETQSKGLKPEGTTKFLNVLSYSKDSEPDSHADEKWPFNNDTWIDLKTDTKIPALVGSIVKTASDFDQNAPWQDLLQAVLPLGTPFHLLIKLYLEPACLQDETTLNSAIQYRWKKETIEHLFSLNPKFPESLEALSKIAIFAIQENMQELIDHCLNLNPTICSHILPAAIADKQIEVTKKLVGLGASLTGPKFMTAFLSNFRTRTSPDAAELCAYLLSLKIDLNQQDNYNEYPLHVAVQASDVTYVKRFLDSGANPNFHPSLLHAAITKKQGAIDCIRLLLDAGIGFKQPITRGIPPQGTTSVLHQAAHVGNLELFEWFVRQGARFDLRDDKNHLPWEQASYQIRLFCYKYQAQQKYTAFRPAEDLTDDIFSYIGFFLYRVTIPFFHLTFPVSLQLRWILYIEEPQIRQCLSSLLESTTYEEYGPTGHLYTIRYNNQNVKLKCKSEFRYQEKFSSFNFSWETETQQPEMITMVQQEKVWNCKVHRPSKSLLKGKESFASLCTLFNFDNEIIQFAFLMVVNCFTAGNAHTNKEQKPDNLRFEWFEHLARSKDGQGWLMEGYRWFMRLCKRWCDDLNLKSELM